MKPIHLDLRVWLSALSLALAFGVAVAQDEAASSADVALETVAEGMNSPVKLVSPPDDARRFVVDRAGVIYRLEEHGSVADEPFLDLRDQIVDLRESFDERGLLGLAFHPDFADNGRYFVYYSAPLRDSAPQDWDHTARVSEFKAAAPGEDADEAATRGDANTTDMASERILLEIDQPQFNHNAGDLAIGPEDGYLYIALGDGGAGNDVALGHPPMGHGQDARSLLGSILRIDVDRGWPGYAIPEDNPYVGELPPDEIFSIGWRNPYRMSFDRETGRLYAATNGQALWEAVYEASEPGNYGWNILEGTHCFNPEDATDPPEECPTEAEDGTPLRMPVIEYPHPDIQGDANVAGVSIIGGYVYHGSEVPALEGHYVFGDWQSQLFAAEVDDSAFEDPEGRGQDAETWPIQQLMQLDAFVLGFGQDADGELYVLTTENTGPTGETGAVHRIVAGDAAEGDDANGADDGDM